MELKAKDTYRVELIEVASNNVIASLISLYQPIIGRDALNFYLTIFFEGLNQKSLETHQRLSIIMNMDIPAMERARKKCEQFFLVRTFYKSDNDKDSYIYIVNPPLSAQAFLKHDLYSRLLLKALGQKQFELTVAKVARVENSKNGFEDISDQFDKNLLASWDADNEVQFSKVQPSFNFTDHDKVNINFNYEELFDTTSALVFPVEARTKENLQIIGEYATLYGLSATKVRILIGKCMNLTTNTLDAEKFKKLCSIQNPDATVSSKDPFMLPPIAFLQARQNGIPVASVDRRLLEYLNLELKLPAEVVNVLVDYVLSVNQNRLTKRFVEAIATTWIREKVLTKEQAIAQTKKSPIVKQGNSTKKKDVLPAYYEKMKAVDKQNNLEIISDEEAREIAKKLKGLSE